MYWQGICLLFTAETQVDSALRRERQAQHLQVFCGPLLTAGDKPGCCEIFWETPYFDEGKPWFINAYHDFGFLDLLCCQLYSDGFD